jgi:Na+-driven multidrug efflux pump
MNDKRKLFASERPAKALAVMALPTVGSQLVLLIYNIADTWFIGRTNDPAMIGASNLALTVYLIAASIANVFGVGGGTLMARLWILAATGFNFIEIKTRIKQVHLL